MPGAASKRNMTVPPQVGQKLVSIQRPESPLCRQEVCAPSIVTAASGYNAA